MSVTALARKSRLSDKGVRNAVKDLKGLGELSVTPRPGGVSLYTLPKSCMVGSPADITGLPRQNLPAQWSTSPADITGPVDEQPEEPQVSGGPAESTGPEISDVLDLDSVVSGGKSRSKPSSEPPREDVERLCERLASRIEANGSKRPAIGKRWRDAARLLIDNDGRTEQQVMAAIDWTQQNEFWHRNILSMPKLREKYDQLRLAALAEQRKKAQPSQRGNPDDEYAAAMQRIKARKENANGARGDGHDSAPRQVSLPPAAD